MIEKKSCLELQFQLFKKISTSRISFLERRCSCENWKFYFSWEQSLFVIYTMWLKPYEGRTCTLVHQEEFSFAFEMGFGNWKNISRIMKINLFSNCDPIVFWLAYLKYGSEEKGSSLSKCSILLGLFMSKKLERLRSELLSEDKITNLLGFLT